MLREGEASDGSLVEVLNAEHMISPVGRRWPPPVTITKAQLQVRTQLTFTTHCHGCLVLQG